MLKPFVVYFNIREVANEVHAVVIAKDESSARKFAERAMAQSVTDDYVVTSVQEMTMFEGNVIL